MAFGRMEQTQDERDENDSLDEITHGYFLFLQEKQQTMEQFVSCVVLPKSIAREFEDIQEQENAVHYTFASSSDEEEEEEEEEVGEQQWDQFRFEKMRTCVLEEWLGICAKGVKIAGGNTEELDARITFDGAKRNLDFTLPLLGRWSDADFGEGELSESMQSSVDPVQLSGQLELEHITNLGEQLANAGPTLVTYLE